MNSSNQQSPVVVLSGGVGGAKLALGMYRILPKHSLSVVVNTGDDFDHCGLRICPDIDTTLYTLSGLSNQQQGWGRENESWNTLNTLTGLGGETWFQLGDKDLALHLYRTQCLSQGVSLTQCVDSIARNMGIDASILPMSDQVVATELDTSEGRLGFQEYFVKRQCQPAVEALHYSGAESSAPTPAVLDALSRDDLQAIVIAPSNPYLSIAPILAVPGMVEVLRQAKAPVIAVSPVIDGAAVKGPTTKIMRELALQPSALTVESFYRDIIDGFVLDEKDESLLHELETESISTNTLMISLEDRESLALRVLEFAGQLRSARSGGL